MAMMPNMSGGYRGSIERPDVALRNQPVPVEFCGWRSDTLRLQQAGWQIAISHDARCFEDIFIFNHENLRLQGVSRGYDSYDALSQRRHQGRFQNVAPIQIQYIGNIRAVQMNTTVNFLEAKTIDCTPSYAEMTEVDLATLFTVVPNQQEALFVDKADMSVVDHLQAVIDGQRDKQAELRMKHRKRLDGCKQNLEAPSDILLQVRAA